MRWINVARACALMLPVLVGAGCTPVGNARVDAPPEREITVVPAEDDGAEVALLQQARNLIDAGKPAEAIDGPLNRIIATFETRPVSDRRVYCARTMAESLLYAAAPDNGGGVLVLSWVWAQAYHMKGYALVELARKDEARRMLERALELSPSNATYLAELAHIEQVEGHSATALELFTRAETASRLASPDEARSIELTRALRGQGYALAEMWRLDEAEQRYRASLDVDPQDDKARGEIGYIQELRASLDRRR